jgi:hypothetical protein
VIDGRAELADELLLTETSMRAGIVLQRLQDRLTEPSMNAPTLVQKLALNV